MRTSPLEKKTRETLSKRQLRHREVGWEGSRTANCCTEAHESHEAKKGGVSVRGNVKSYLVKKPYLVYVAGVARKYAYLSREICIGVRNNNPTSAIGRKRSPIQKSAEVIVRGGNHQYPRKG